MHCIQRAFKALQLSRVEISLWTSLLSLSLWCSTELFDLGLRMNQFAGHCMSPPHGNDPNLLVLVCITHLFQHTPNEIDPRRTPQSCAISVRLTVTASSADSLFESTW